MVEPDAGLESVVIVGGSLAAVRCATALRRGGFAGTLTILNGEVHKPYDRPPLSKQVLRGEWELPRVALLKQEQVDLIDADWRNGVQATHLDIDSLTVSTSDTRTFQGDALVVATGARARELPGTSSMPQVKTLRTADDAKHLHAVLADSRLQVVVIGAGFIGGEVAASAVQLGHHVTILEASQIPLERGLGPELGPICGDLHSKNGVDLRLGVEVASIEDTTDGKGAVTVHLIGGEELVADLVVVGIGAVPNTEWLEGVDGIEIDNGVMCDNTCQAAPGVYAIGDVCRFYHEAYDEHVRIEHWDNAVEQGVFVANRLLGSSEIFAPVPWFWSDQYDAKIQLAGRTRPGDEMTIVTGSVDEGRFAAVLGQGDDFNAVFGMNRPRHVMQYRRLLADGAGLADALAHAADK